MKVLFLCTGNSCRSILSEAIFNHLAPSGWQAMSAGSQPTGEVHPRALDLLKREGISIEGLHSKSWKYLPQPPEIVLSLCTGAAGELCSACFLDALRADWSVEDPAHATGSEEEIEAAFLLAYRLLRNRIETLFELPLEPLEEDPKRLEKELRRIGTLLPSTNL